MSQRLQVREQIRKYYDIDWLLGNKFAKNQAC